jgi:hypothetical protein
VLKKHKNRQTEKFSPALFGEVAIFYKKKLRVYSSHPEEMAGNCKQ